MKNQTEADVFSVISRVTALMPCGPCGRGGLDPRIPEANASAVRTFSA